MMRTRLRILLGVFGALFAVIAGRLFSMQVVDGSDYELEAFRRLQRVIELAPRRGTIVDRSGIPLAINEPGYDLMVVPAELRQDSVGRLLELLHWEVEEFEERLVEVEARIEAETRREIARQERGSAKSLTAKAARKIESKFHEVGWLLWPDLTDAEARLTIYIHPDTYAGFTIRPRAIRRYPQGDLACHAIGYLSQIASGELAQRRQAGYFLNDLVGRSGIEGELETELRGKRGLKVLERDAANRVRNLLFDDPPEPGRDVTLTIDAVVQREAEEVLDRAASKIGAKAPDWAGASAVVMDVTTGDLLVLATSPRYDPNRITLDFRELLADPRRPLHDRAVGGPRLASPGSVFKILTAIAGIEAGTLDPAAIHSCRGFLHEPGKFRCWRTGGHGLVDLSRAIEESCNVYFYIEGEALAKVAGDGVLSAWARAFGFGETCRIGHDGELPGNVPDPESKRERTGEGWYPGDSRYLAIGQGAIDVTPLQITRFMGAVATGRLVRPRLLAGASPLPAVDVPVNSTTLSIVREAMRRVVEGPRGTARHEPLRRLRASVKTGTTEAGGDLPDHAWIAGFAPREAPRVAFAVLVQHAGGHGGEVAGPIAGEILIEVARALGGW